MLYQAKISLVNLTPKELTPCKISHICRCAFNEYFKKNALLYQYIYSTLFPKYFCRVDDYGIKSKLAFEVTHTGHQSQQQSLYFVQLPVKQEQTVTQEQTEIDQAIEVVETSTPPPKTTQKSKKKQR